MNFEKLNETSCRINDIQNNDEILIGGSKYGKLDQKVIADIDSFEVFFQVVEKNAKNFENNESMKKWLNSVAPDFDVKAFAHMYAFDNILRKMYPDLSSNVSKRQRYYNTEGDKKISQSFSNGVCQCAEISILAQAYFQKHGFNTKYFGGELLHSTQEEFGDPHSFIELKTEKEDYFYDPANPIIYDGIFLPRISSIEATQAQKQQFENKIHTSSERRNCAFLEAKDIVTKSTCYYGCGDGANIFPSFIISRNNIQDPASHVRS